MIISISLAFAAFVVQPQWWPLYALVVLMTRSVAKDFKDGQYK
jgi:hypothetical protein